MARQLHAANLGFDPIDLADDEVPDGALLLVRVQASNHTRLVSRGRRRGLAGPAGHAK